MSQPVEQERATGTDRDTPPTSDGDGSQPMSMQSTLSADDDDEQQSNELDDHTQRHIEGMVLHQLFGLEPVSQSIGRYRVLESIGRGGMGTVFAAYDEQLDRKVAIKVLDSKRGSVAAASLRLKREAQALARLSHPNVVTVYEVGEADDEVFVAMEFLRGQSLEAWLEEHPPWQEVLSVFIEAGRGIVAAHGAGLIHRDLKPHNIMRTEDGVVKVLDFGLARAHDTQDLDDAGLSRSSDTPLSNQLTRTGAAIGTPAYMAPEQFRGEWADERTDQFGFCAALFHTLYGRLPFDAPTAPEIVAKLSENQLTPPPSDTQVPAWVHRVVVRGLSIDPTDRWPSMQALLAALQRDPARTRRRWAMAAGLGLLAGLGGYSISQLQAAAEQACPTVEDEREALWSEERRASIKAAFEASGSPLAPDTIARTAGPIAAYVDAMGQLRADSCEAHRLGQESARLFDLRTACLDVRRAGFEQLAQQFEEANASTVDNAAWAVASLPLVAPCDDPEALTAAVPPPEDPQVAQQVQQQREALASARSLALTGAHQDATTWAHATLEQAQTTGYDPIVAEAQVRLGDILRVRGEHQRAEEVLSEAVRSSIESVHYEAAVEALALRMWIVADPLARPQEALANDEIASAMLETIDRPAYLEWLLLNNRAVAFFRSGDLDQAEHSYQNALAVALSMGEGAMPVEVISTRANLAMFEAQGLGRPDVAAKQLSSARAEALRLLGPQHPRVSLLTSLLVEHLASAGRPTEALAVFESEGNERSPDTYRQVELLVELARLHHLLRHESDAFQAADEALALAKHAMPDTYLVSVAQWNRGTASIGLGRIDEGTRDLMAAVEREVARAGPDSDAAIAAQLWAGHGLHLAARLDDATIHLERALQSTVGRGPVGNAMLGRRFFDLVDVYLDQGELSSAEALIDRIADAQDTAGFSSQSHYRLLLAKLRGDVLMARDSRAAARASYERAVEGLAGQVEPSYPDLADARLALARAIGEGDRARALAQQAADAYQLLGTAFDPERARAEALLDALVTSPSP